MSTSSSGEYKVSINARDVFCVPNIVTLARLIFVPFIIYCLAQRESLAYQMTSFGLMAVCFFTDWLDGYLARRLNQVSALGKMLDPLVDKVVVAAFIISLVIYRDLPLWAIIIFISKDLGLMLAGLFLVNRRKIAIAANLWGKINLWMLGGMSGLYVINAPFRIVFLIAALITTAISAVNYGVIFTRIIRTGGQPER